MALVVFLRGVNVGGHRTFRPSVLASQLERYGVVNVGAAGTFVVRNPGTRTAFTSALRRALPFETHIMLCDARALLRAHADQPYGPRAARRDVVRFVSVLSKASSRRASLPLQLPGDGKWFVRILAVNHPFLFGEYRRHMKTIGYLGQIDRLVGSPVTTRSWSTIETIVRILEAEAPEPA
ncbi:MAG TPA: DUF1697 domain-containing protein [Gemmatimonadaceae bacterium]|jgi:uncharacterized protein (DUF1697 family)